MTRVHTPRLHLASVTEVTFAYDPRDDIAILHIGRPRPGITDEVDAGWYLRLTGDESEVLGIELHGLRRKFLSDAFFAPVFTAALDEIQQHTGQTIDAPLDITGAATAYPHTSQLLLFLLGQATARFTALQRAEYNEASEGLFNAVGS